MINIRNAIIEKLVGLGYKVKDEVVHAIWDPDRAIEGVFCPKCNTWMDDYEGQPDKCPNCGVKLDGWVDVRSL